MDKQKDFIEVRKKFAQITDKPENFLCVQEALTGKIKKILKKLYDLAKAGESGKKYKNALPSLVIQDFDEEQIWQQIELQNDSICDGIVADIAHLLAKKGNLDGLSEGESDDEDEESDAKDNKEGLKGESGDEEELEEESGDEEELEEESEDEEKSFKEQKKVPEMAVKGSVVDDQFFKLQDMEQFLKKVENEDEKKEEIENESEEVDYFAEDDSDVDSPDSEDAIRYRYSDFFDAPNAEERKKRKKLSSESEQESKKVRFNVEESENEDESGEEEEKEVQNKRKSSFEARQERLKGRIEALEEESVSAKPWQMKGEVTAVTRPQNSLLEEYVEFDLATRPAPVITEQCTLRLEQVIEQRIKDKAWDDVQRKIKPIESVGEYKKRLVLDQEKSKQSLAEIYEQEYIKQRDGAAAAAGGQPVEIKDEVPQAHIEIKNMMKSLMQKLDALCNFHYTPKQVTPEVKIISNLPAVEMEEVAPVAISDATLLAPEEIKQRAKGDVKGKEERTVTDKKRDRRQKKIKQRLRKKEKDAREKAVEKLNPGLGNKYSKEKAKKMLEKVAKEGNVTQIKENSGKYLKSSKTFFTQLQDEVSTLVKKQSPEKRQKKKTTKFSAKKLKL